MINRIGRCENNVVVAVFADIRGLDMGRILTNRVVTVMATGTVVHDVGVIERCRYPANGCVAIVAVIATGNVRWRFSCRNRTVVAGRAGAHYLGVVHDIDWRKKDIVVAVLADFRCLDMRRVLADCVATVVAAEAIARDVDVIEIGRSPRVGCMAVLTIVAAGDMRRVFTRGKSAIVAG